MLLNTLGAIGAYLSTKYYKKYYEKNLKYVFEQDRGAEKAFIHFMLNLYPEVRFLEMFRLIKVAFIKLREKLNFRVSRTVSASQKLAIFLYICGYNIKQKPAGEMFKQFSI